MNANGGIGGKAPPGEWDTDDPMFASELPDEPQKEKKPVAFNGNRGGNKQPYKHKPNRGSMFDNDKKTKDQQPDMTGSIDINGTIYWISGWKEMSESGKRRLSLAVTLQEERTHDQQRQPQSEPARRQPKW